ncbi:MAG TPA: CaiB/BaiF CoA-transferase family protein [Blastocatellia bacterium]|jgi:crotonobetainyl-CoA:carnitine CoA-transferase CaiB-like acyl-CoA transferase|nr:CaiB/BaiF CoA-transferase family protein [Blastocatellia bacterium]
MKPLDNVTVLDLTRLLPGAVATMTLGDFGADVIKIEEPGIGDPARQMRAGIKRAGAYFLATNRNKRSLTINLKDERGREIFLRLAEKADVVVEGFRPGVMDRLGLGYGALKGVNPRLIYCAITGYGQDGPYRLKAGHDANYLSVAGLLGMNGPKGGPPTLSGVQLADLAGGSLHAVIGVLLALQARARTGEGQFVDISMTDTSLSMMYVPFATFLADGLQPERGAGGLSGRYACYQIYETKDGRYLSLGALEHKFWENACRVLGREDFIGECFNEGAQEKIIAAFREIFETRTAAEWLAAFENVDTCVALVNDIAEMVEDPQIKHRGLIAEIEHPTEGRLKQIAPTVKLSATPAAIEAPPPLLGGHTREILKGLDYDDETIKSLAREGVVSL